MFEAPSAKRLWRGSFDRTQHSLGSRPGEASQLPGNGTRWLTASELATWGMEQTVDRLLDRQSRRGNRRR